MRPEPGLAPPAADAADSSPPPRQTPQSPLPTSLPGATPRSRPRCPQQSTVPPRTTAAAPECPAAPPALAVLARAGQRFCRGLLLRAPELVRRPRLIGSAELNGSGGKRFRCGTSAETDQPNGLRRSGIPAPQRSANPWPGSLDRTKHMRSSEFPAPPGCEPRFPPTRCVAVRPQQTQDAGQRPAPETSPLLPGLPSPPDHNCAAGRQGKSVTPPRRLPVQNSGLARPRKAQPRHRDRGPVAPKRRW